MEKVFYIDQEEFVCSMVELALKFDGIDVFSHSHPEDAQYLIEDFAPDVLLVDISTLLQTKWQHFLHELKSSPHTQGIPLLAVGEPQDFNKITDYGHYFSGTIIKPLSPTSLRPKLQEVLGSRQMLH